MPSTRGGHLSSAAVKPEPPIWRKERDTCSFLDTRTTFTSLPAVIASRSFTRCIVSMSTPALVIKDKNFCCPLPAEDILPSGCSATNEHVFLKSPSASFDSNIKICYKILLGQKKDVHNELISGAMRRDRFIQIMKFLHLVDNTKLDRSDRFYKVRPMLRRALHNKRRNINGVNLLHDNARPHVAAPVREICQICVGGAPASTIFVLIKHLACSNPRAELTATGRVPRWRIGNGLQKWRGHQLWLLRPQMFKYCEVKLRRVLKFCLYDNVGCSV
ncbi:hypothetical protein J437_LFUL006647 [Ladona fulva]|uniref:PiggyBac transposable element-derived protein domain-containing protein n=1 Tax=Ladona fulva TaxID=123851 RepID=A0A8K0K2C5_LADFU|nr:hypothetical protein J437_LFUL006647 [Ladona fulva]